MYDAMLLPGQVLGVLEDLEPQGPGQQPLSVLETTFMNISQMRHARDERASTVDDFGRVW